MKKINSVGLHSHDVAAASDFGLHGAACGTHLCLSQPLRVLLVSHVASHLRAKICAQTKTQHNNRHSGCCRRFCSLLLTLSKCVTGVEMANATPHAHRQSVNSTYVATGKVSLRHRLLSELSLLKVCHLLASGVVSVARVSVCVRGCV